MCDVNSTDLSPGRNWGQRWVASFTAAFNVVSGVGSPPAADTRIRPLPGSGANTIVPSPPHDAPRLRLTLVIVSGVPPAVGTLRISVAVTKPTHSPSGEKNGW